MSPPGARDRVERRLARLRRKFDGFDVVEEETVVPRAMYTDSLQSAEAGALGGARVAVRRDDAVLLVRYRDQPEAWDLPGGPTERGECLEETARYRVLEDTGLSVTIRGVDRAVKQSFTLVEGGDGVVGLWVFFEATTNDADVSPGEDVLEAEWFEAGELPESVGPHVRTLLERRVA